MNSFDVVVVGSGPAGVAAARRLQGCATCIVDVGELPSSMFPFSSLGEALASGDVQALLGDHCEMLANLVEPKRMHAKLRAPGVAHVIRGEPFRVLDDQGVIYHSGNGSFAAGGLSCAWGAQLFRYTDADLATVGGWPIDASALEPYYADLEQHIGIAGERDDVGDFLGDCACLLPPALLAPSAQYLFDRYTEVSRREGRSMPLQLGRSRLGLLTTPYRGYAEYRFGETEFFTTEAQGIYSARRTLDELRGTGAVTYFGGYRLIGYRERAEHVEADLIIEGTQEVKTLRARHLLLACGAMQTARLVLLGHGALGQALPFVDHTPTLLPLFIPRLFGAALPARSFPVQLVGTLTGGPERDMISIYYPGGLLWSDLLGDIPLPMNAALRLLPILLGGMLVAQIWEPNLPLPENRLMIDAEGTVTITHARPKTYSRLRKLLSAMRRLGVWSSRRFASVTPPGWGFHYAGSLPMRDDPGPFETHIDGKLWDSQRVRVVDGSVLPSLPAKNHSLTLMANAARIADEVQRCGY